MSDQQGRRPAGKGFGRLWADPASRRLLLFGLVMIGAFVVIGLITWSNRPAGPTSQAAAPPALDATPGGRVSDNYAQQLRSDDRQRVETAKASEFGPIPRSATPTPHDIPTADEDQPTIRPDHSPLRTGTTPLYNSPPAVAAQGQADAERRRADARRDQMEAMLTELQQVRRTFDTAPPVIVTVSHETGSREVGDQVTAPTNAPPAGRTASPPEGAGAPTPAPAEKSPIRKPLAGTIWYARLISKANSDHPGPILAEVLQGPYTGARLIGSFQTQSDALVIQFTTISVPSLDASTAIQAYAVDSKDIGTGLATDVDRHVAVKLAIGFLNGLAQGVGTALQSSGSVTVNSGTGTVVTSNPTLNIRDKAIVAGGAVAQQAGDVLQQTYGSIPTTITVDAGTAIGVLFL